MARTCTVCAHASADAIDRALIDGQSNRGIARDFGLGDDAVRRHAGNHLPRALAETVAAITPATDARQTLHAAERIGDSIDIMAEIARQLARVNKLSDAVDEWLTDPENPERYEIGPRSYEVTVVYEDLEDRNENGKPRRKKETLEELLGRVDGRFSIQRSETKFADPRKLLLDAAGGLKEHLQLLTTILDKLHSAEQAERFEAAVLAAIGEASPDVRTRIEESLRHSHALRQLAGRPLG